MKIIYLRQKKSGNFEITEDSKKATHKFKTQKSFREWYEGEYDRKGQISCRTGKIIKATYRLSQTYFYSAQEVIDHCKKNQTI